MRNSYRPTPAEKEKCAILLAALRLPAAAYGRYRKEVAAFLEIFAKQAKARRASAIPRGRNSPLAPRGASGGISRFGTRKSVLFGKEYLVAYADARWLRGQAPGTDAIASPCLMHGVVSSPPLVLMPETQEKSRDPAFLSILEHEFVHVHQFLLGTCTEAAPDTAEDWLREIFRLTRAEYEANFIQLARWPGLFSKVREVHHISLEDFCALRGYTHGLQNIFQAAALGKLAENELLKFLERLPAELPSAFQRIGLDKRLGKEYAAMLPADVGVTLKVLAEASPGLKRALDRPALRSWLKARLPKTPKPAGSKELLCQGQCPASSRCVK